MNWEGEIPLKRADVNQDEARLNLSKASERAGEVPFLLRAVTRKSRMGKSAADSTDAKETRDS